MLSTTDVLSVEVLSIKGNLSNLFQMIDGRDWKRHQIARASWIHEGYTTQ